LLSVKLSDCIFWPNTFFFFPFLSHRAREHPNSLALLFFIVIHHRWVTEMQDLHKMKDTAGDLSDGRGAGIDNLLYSADAEFSCFADLALVSPGEYYKPGEGSLMQVRQQPTKASRRRHARLSTHKKH